jgi:hypothetical protein
MQTPMGKAMEKSHDPGRSLDAHVQRRLPSLISPFSRAPHPPLVRLLLPAVPLLADVVQHRFEIG